MAEKAIVYITDNALDERLARKCRENLVTAAEDIPIVCVSQLPLDFGDVSVAVGRLPRSVASIVRQILAGLERTDARWVFIAEHDCVYSPEHFRFTPNEEPSCFWYNRNFWLVQARNPRHPEYDGMYSRKRGAFHQSQMVAEADLMREAQRERLTLLEDPAWASRYPSGRLGEPGAASEGRAMELTEPVSLRFLRPRVLRYCLRWEARTFETATPNLDIRHGGNFTGPLRGGERRWSLEPWGTWDSVFS